MSSLSAEASGRSGQKLNFELPHDKDGKVNWDVLGKILTAKLLGEVVNASHVDRKYSELKLTESFKADTDWEYCYEKDQVVVLRKKTQRTCFMGRGVINMPMNVVAEFIKDVQSFFTWDDLLIEARYVKTIKETEREADYIGYHFFQAVQRCGIINVKRDMLYFVRSAYIDGKYVHSAMSVEDPDYPPMLDVPRMTLHMGSGFVAEPYHGDPHKTLLSYLAHIDTKGIPSVINSQVLKRHPMAISKIRRNFERRASREHTHSSSVTSPPNSPTHSYKSGRYYNDPLQVGHYVTGSSS